MLMASMVVISSVNNLQMLSRCCEPHIHTCRGVPAINVHGKSLWHPVRGHYICKIALEKQGFL